MKTLKKTGRALYGIVACAVLLTACAKQPSGPSGDDPDENGPGGNKFDYATTADVRLDIDYSLKGNKAVFEVYAENPVTEQNGILSKKAGVQARLKVYTDGNSKFSGTVNLPTATDKVWLYSESYGLPTCVETPVTASGISFNLDSFLENLASQRKDRTAAAAQASLTRGGSTPDNILNVQTPLGGYDMDGKPDYLEKTAATVPDGLMNRVQNVLLPGTNNSQYALPTEKVNIKITQEASLKLVFLSELSQWANAIGYYYYETGHAPKTLQEFLDLPKYVALPNCSMYNGNYEYPGYKPPLKPGMQVRLKYFGPDGQPSDKFPAGITVGWFIMPNGFNISWGQLIKPTNFAKFKGSNNEFNQGGARCMVSLYDKPSGKTILGFEDGGDNDYKDVLFYVESDPADAIYNPDQPTTDPDDEKYPDVVGDPITGTLAFEDLWPSQGDYDMNDVVLKYSTTFTTDKDNKIVSIKDVFTPLHNGGQLKNAFGYQLDIPAADVKSVKIENGSSSARTVNNMELNQEKAVIMLFDDIRLAVAQGPITVEIVLNGNIYANKVTRKSLYNYFVCVSDKGFVPGQTRKEIHLTDYAPTDLADLSFFGIRDDKSSVDKQGNPTGPYYYVTSDLHPFAIDLPITDYRIPDEMVKIDNFYPQFAGWVNSKGEKNKEWYLNPKGK